MLPLHQLTHNRLACVLCLYFRVSSVFCVSPRGSFSLCLHLWPCIPASVRIHWTTRRLAQCKPTCTFWCSAAGQAIGEQRNKITKNLHRESGKTKNNKNKTKRRRISLTSGGFFSVFNTGARQLSSGARGSVLSVTLLGSFSIRFREYIFFVITMLKTATRQHDNGFFFAR